MASTNYKSQSALRLLSPRIGYNSEHNHRHTTTQSVGASRWLQLTTKASPCSGCSVHAAEHNHLQHTTTQSVGASRTSPCIGAQGAEQPQRLQLTTKASPRGGCKTNQLSRLKAAPTGIGLIVDKKDHRTGRQPKKPVHAAATTQNTTTSRTLPRRAWERVVTIISRTSKAAGTTTQSVVARGQRAGRQPKKPARAAATQSTQRLLIHCAG